MTRILSLLFFLLFVTFSSYSQCIICPPDCKRDIEGNCIEDGGGSGGGGSGGGGGGSGGGGTFTYSFVGPTDVDYNGTYTYSVEGGGIVQNTDYAISGGIIIYENNYSVQVKWTSYGSGWVRANSTVSNEPYTETVNVNVTGPLSGGSISTSSTNVCYNGNPSNISNSASATGGDGNHSYFWQQSTNGGSSWSNAGGNGTGFNPPNLTSDRKYRRKVTSNGQTAYSNVISYNVYSNLNPRTISYSGGNVNPGGSLSIAGAAATGGNGSYSYQWQKKTTGGYSNISGKTGRDLGSVTQSVTTTYRRRVQSCGTKYSNEITVTTNLVAGGVSSGSGTQLYYGQDAAPITSDAARGASGSYTYQWQESNDNITWSNLGSASSSPQPYDPPALTADKWYRMKVTSGGQTAYKTIKLSVYPELVNTGISYSGSSTISPEGTISITGSLPNGGSGSYTYQWQKKETSGYEDIPGATSKDLVDYPQTVTTAYRRITSSGQVLASNEVVITTALQAGSIGADQLICPGELTSIPSAQDATGGSGIYEYTWKKRSANNPIDEWENLNGFVTSYPHYDFDLTPISEPTEYMREVTSGGQTVQSNVITVTPMELEAGQLTYTYGNVSEGEIPGPIAGEELNDRSGLTGVTYAWSKKGTFTGTSFESIAGATGASYTPTDPIYEPTIFKRTAYVCDQNEEATIHADIQYPTLIAGSLSTPDERVCFSCDLNEITGTIPSGGTGEYAYQWQMLNIGTGIWEDVACPFSESDVTGGGPSDCELELIADQKDFDPQPSLIGAAKIMKFRRLVTSYNQTAASDTVVILREDPLVAGKITYGSNPCQDAPLGLVSGAEPTGGMGGYAYTWEQYDGTNWITVGNEQNYYSEELLSGEVQFKRTVTSSDGSTSTSDVLTITPITCKREDFNYVRVEVPKQPVTSHLQLSNLPYTEKATTYSYSDGSGRPLQTVVVAAGQNQEDVISFHHYNAYTGKQDKTYLAYYQDTTVPGMIQNQPEVGQANFYASADGITHDSHPFSKHTFDDRGRLKSTTSVGEEWHTNNKKTRFDYQFYVPGTDAAIGQWKINENGKPENHAIYGANEVRMTITTDVEGRKSRTAIDPLGRQITSQLFDESNGKWYGSYNVYDDYGRVRFVIPAAITSTITDTNLLGELSDQQIAEQLFQYEYDRLGRVIRKKDPGAGWVEIIYDQWDRPVLTRHAAQQLDGANAWTFTKYDSWNRPVFSGLVVTGLSTSELRNEALLDSDRFEIEVNSEVGYSLNSSFPQLGSTDFPTYKVLSVSYYDNYDYQSNTDWDVEGEDFSFGLPAGFTADSTSNVLNQVTGGKTRVLGSDKWLNSVVYYDDRLRVIQTITENHLGGTERMTNQLDWKGELQKMIVEHTSDTETVSVLTEYEYAHNGQLLKTWQTIDEPGNAGERVLVAAYNYNVLGQLTEKNLHALQPTGQPEPVEGFLQSVDYDYNIKGWISSINNAGLDDGENDVFGMEFNYTNPVTVNGETMDGRYDGNLTSSVWNADNSPLEGGQTPLGQGGVGGKTITAFTYDDRNRLTHTSYATDNAGSWTGDAGAYDMSASYDDSGNMNQLSRKAGGETVDDISYQYEAGTHRLEKVAELSASPDKGKGFDDKNDILTEYTYDVMGNMTSDMNKEIVEVTYNHLQLVETIAFGDGTTIDFMYDAGGNRLSKTITDGGGNVLGKVDYVGLIEYYNDEVNQVATAEGRAYKQNNKYHYEYFLMDQQGNNRVAFGNLPERNIYTATMEDENPEFDWTGVTRVPTENHTPAGTQSTALNNAANRTLGPAKVLDIAAGDEVEINVWAKYTDDPLGSGTVFGNVIDALLAMTGGTTTDGGVGEALNNTVGSAGTNPFPIDGNASSNEDAPDAYLAYLFFDEHYNFVADKSSFQSVTEQSFEQWSELKTPEKLVFDQPGHLFVYVANESQEDQEVYFDDLRIIHENETRSFKVTQVNEYYPYGMQTDKSWRAEGYIDPGLMYQSAYASYDSISGYYDFLYRSYDPALGRFFATDPLASSTPSYSPYHANFNNPVMFRDPWGLTPEGSNGTDDDWSSINNMINSFLRSTSDDGSSGMTWTAGLGWGSPYGGQMAFINAASYNYNFGFWGAVPGSAANWDAAAGLYNTVVGAEVIGPEVTVNGRSGIPCGCNERVSTWQVIRGNGYIGAVRENIAMDMINQDMIRFTLGSHVNGNDISDYSIQVLADNLIATGNHSATISSAYRPPSHQARVMFQNAHSGGSQESYDLYAPSGDKVIDTYVLGKILQGVSSDLNLGSVSNLDIIRMMTHRILELGPVNVSNHGMNPAISNVLDLAPSSLRNTEALHRSFLNDPRINREKFFTPYNSRDRAFHIQIPQLKVP